MVCGACLNAAPEIVARMGRSPGVAGRTTKGDMLRTMSVCRKMLYGVGFSHIFQTVYFDLSGDGHSQAARDFLSNIRAT